MVAGTFASPTSRVATIAIEVWIARWCHYDKATPTVFFAVPAQQHTQHTQHTQHHTQQHIQVSKIAWMNLGSWNKQHRFELLLNTSITDHYVQPMHLHPPHGRLCVNTNLNV